MRTMPLLVAAMTVAAITLSAGGAYAAVARDLHVQETPSAELLKLHASQQMMADRALTQPDLPPFVASVSIDSDGVVVTVTTPNRY